MSRQIATATMEGKRKGRSTRRRGIKYNGNKKQAGDDQRPTGMEEYCI